jgi:hypothetical protein
MCMNVIEHLSFEQNWKDETDGVVGENEGKNTKT